MCVCEHGQIKRWHFANEKRREKKTNKKNKGKTSAKIERNENAFKINSEQELPGQRKAFVFERIQIELNRIASNRFESNQIKSNRSESIYFESQHFDEYKLNGWPMERINCNFK